MSAFTQIPDNLRLPGVRVEFDARRAVTGTPQIQHRVLVMGQRLTSGTVGALVPTRVTSDTQADEYFGRGSMLAEMLKAALKAWRYLEIWGIAINEDASGVKATGSVTFAGPATAAGTVNLYVGGVRARVGVAKGATSAQIATATAAAVNANTALPLVAVVNEGNTSKVDFTCRWKGETGNDIDLRVNAYSGERLPDGVTATFVAMASGATNPDAGNLTASFGPQWWTYIINPFNDTSNLDVLADELVARWDAMRDKRVICFGAFRGTYGATATFGDARNDFPISTMATGKALTPPWIWAAVYGLVSAASLSNHPARGLQTLELPGVKGAPVEDQFEDSERNALLFDGMSTHTVDLDGTVRIEMAITMYQTNASGIEDTSWLKVQTLAINTYMAFARRARLSKFARSMLADDGTDFDPSLDVVTPSRIRTELIDLAKEFERKGIMENVDQYKRDLTVVRDTDNRNRVNVFESPDHVNQLDLLAMQLAWLN